MSKQFKNTLESLNTAPGSLIYIGDKAIRDVTVTITEYDQAEVRQFQAQHIEECLACKFSSKISWINIDGVHNVELIRTLGEQFGLHPLLLEDVLNTELRPKIEFYTDYVVVILKMLDYDETKKKIESEQVSLILGPQYVISLQEEREGDVFNPVRTRLQTSSGKIRRAGADFLFYSLIDTVVDNYFMVLEKIGEALEPLEGEITTGSTTQQSAQTLYYWQRELIHLRKAVWPLREIVNSLEREETPLIKKDMRKYVRDLNDHVIQIIDTIESYRESTASLLSVYLSSLSNRTNDVVKTLTIISTIFMPLTFIAGVYGMNFEYMPELKWKYGYFGVLGVMGVALLMMLYYFRRKKWL